MAMAYSISKIKMFNIFIKSGHNAYLRHSISFKICAVIRKHLAMDFCGEFYF